jgi:hypothetical protein
VRELGKYKLDFVGVQEVIWVEGNTQQAEDYTFFCGQGNWVSSLRDRFFHA